MGGSGYDKQQSTVVSEYGLQSSIDESEMQKGIDQRILDTNDHDDKSGGQYQFNYEYDNVDENSG